MRPAWALLALLAAGACSSASRGTPATDGGGADTGADADAVIPPDPRAGVCADAGASPPFELVQRIFDENCVSCHAPGADLVLGVGVSWGNLVQQPAPPSESCGGVLVVPGDPASSYLYQKLTSATPCYGTQMPAGEFGPQPLPACVTAIVRDWIAEGAPAPTGDAGTD
jgi:hypothetical protein